MKLLIIDIF